MAVALTIADFSGGLTDNVKLGKTNQAEKINNFLVNDEGGLIKRNGSWLYDSIINRISSAEPVRHIIEEQDNVFICSNRNLYRISSTPTLHVMAGPTVSQPFTVSTVDDYFSSTSWQGHIFFTNDSYAYPIKLYKDAAGTWQLRTSGVPLIDVSTVTLTPSAGVGINTYVYAFCWFYTVFFQGEHSDFLLLRFRKDSLCLI